MKSTKNNPHPITKKHLIAAIRNFQIRLGAARKSKDWRDINNLYKLVSNTTAWIKKSESKKINLRLHPETHNQ